MLHCPNISADNYSNIQMICYRIRDTNGTDGSGNMTLDDEHCHNESPPPYATRRSMQINPIQNLAFMPVLSPLSPKIIRAATGSAQIGSTIQKQAGRIVLQVGPSTPGLFADNGS